MYYYEGVLYYYREQLFRSQKPQADEVIFSEEKFQKPLLINFFAHENNLFLPLRGFLPKEGLSPPCWHRTGESMTRKAVVSILMPQPAGRHWLGPSCRTPQRRPLRMAPGLGNTEPVCFQKTPTITPRSDSPSAQGFLAAMGQVAWCSPHCPTKPLTLWPDTGKTGLLE